MKVKYIGEGTGLTLTKGKIYEVISIERDWYRIETDMIGDYLFPPQVFEIIEP